ncbi:MAG: multicopper oxidase domain-containing protein [Deltaproteobacteria bacterium]|nr:multicopper oxidase domain-containing protein [Deltaproteobacteria bacterium]
MHRAIPTIGRWFLAALSLPLFLSGCGFSSQTFTQEPEPEEPVKYSCNTPEDAVSAADLVLTVKDVSLEIRDGEIFEAWTYNGQVPGPVLRMNLGETKRIKLVNYSPRPASLHFHGAAYPLIDDGITLYPEGVVNPGCAHVYTVTASSPGVWPFHSHLDTSNELVRGLYGALIVPDPAEPPADHEFVLFMGQLGTEGEEEGEEHEHIKNHESSHEEENSSGKHNFSMVFNGRPDGKGPVIRLAGDQYEFIHGEMPRTRIGDLVRWRVLNVSPDAWHTIGFHQHVFCDRGGVVDSLGACPREGQLINILDVSPLKGMSFEFIEAVAGTWMYHCHILDHAIEGMMAFYQVDP